jgi:hypothetical protein
MNYIYILYYYYYYYYITIIMVRDGRVKEHLFKQNFMHRKFFLIFNFKKKI